MRSLNSVVDLLAINPCCISDADGVRTASYHPFTAPIAELVGGRDYVWMPDLPRSKHDGGTYISPTVPWDGTLADHPDFLAGVGETTPTADGCWVLREPGEVYVEDYGAVGDDTTDDWAPINAAVNRELRKIDDNNTRAGVVKLRDAHYLVGQTLNIKSTVDFQGMYGYIGRRQGSSLRFVADTTGIIINRDDTIDDIEASPTTGDGLGSRVVRMVVMSQGGTDTTAHGVWMRRRCVLENMLVRDFPGNGVNIVASAETSNPARLGNANSWVLRDITSTANTGDGVYVDGADVNAGIGIAVDCTNNGGWGINDSSFLGNTWLGCHTSANSAGPYNSDNANARSVFLGCYSEGNMGPSNFDPPSLRIGGLHGAGVTPGANGWDGEDIFLRDVESRGAVKVSKSTTGQNNTFFLAANKQPTPHRSFMVTYLADCSFKQDGTTPRPAGGLYCSPQTSDPLDESEVGFFVYTGETTDTVVKVARFWGRENFSPHTDATTALGDATHQWTDIFLVNSPTVSSDGALKQDIHSLSDAEEAVARRLKRLVRTFRRKADVAARGDKARTHVGVIAQDVEKAFADEGLDPWEYAILCRNPGSDGDEQFSVRYEELLAFIIAAL